GQTLTFRFRQFPTGNLITWHSIYGFGTDITSTMIPTGTTNAKYEVGCRFHQSEAKWRIVGLARGVQIMADYCVRAGATGADDGSNWNNAYPDLPTTLERGSTYYIADGSYDGYTFNDVVSGTTLITIKKATVSDHGGIETGWSDAYGDGQAIF